MNYASKYGIYKDFHFLNEPTTIGRMPSFKTARHALKGKSRIKSLGLSNQNRPTTWGCKTELAVVVEKNLNNQ